VIPDDEKAGSDCDGTDGGVGRVPFPWAEVLGDGGGKGGMSDGFEVEEIWGVVFGEVCFLLVL
jgi:hypothetical protein